MSAPPRANDFVLRTQGGEIELEFVYRSPGLQAPHAPVSLQSVSADALIRLVLTVVAALDPTRDPLTLERVRAAVRAKSQEAAKIDVNAN